MENRFKVGVITATHGIRGEIKVFPTTDDPARFKKLKEVILNSKNDELILHIQSVKFFKQYVILKFKEFSDINEIEKYKKAELYVTRENAVELEQDEYFIADLIGLDVMLETGEHFGRLEDVLETGANDVYVIESDKYGEILLPAIKECIVKVDVETGVILIRLMKGIIPEEEK